LAFIVSISRVVLCMPMECSVNNTVPYFRSCPLSD